MKMPPLLLDAGLPYLTCELLKKEGYDVIHADDLGYGTTDVEIVRVARAESRVIFTLDADFHAILAQEAATKPSVARLRVQSLRHEAAAELITRIIQACHEDLEQGSAVSATHRTLRIHRLPLS